jgi:hypothetical protein
VKRTINILDPQTEAEYFRAGAGLLAGEPEDITAPLEDIRAEQTFDLLRHVMEGGE